MKYTEEHEWLRTDGDVVVVGITEHAAEQVGRHRGTLLLVEFTLEVFGGALAGFRQNQYRRQDNHLRRGRTRRAGALRGGSR